MNEPQNATWDDVRASKVQAIIAAAERVAEAEGWIGTHMQELRRLRSEMKKTREALENAHRIRDDRTSRVTKYVEDYQKIGIWLRCDACGMHEQSSRLGERCNVYIYQNRCDGRLFGAPDPTIEGDSV